MPAERFQMWSGTLTHPLQLVVYLRICLGVALLKIVGFAVFFVNWCSGNGRTHNRLFIYVSTT